MLGLGVSEVLRTSNNSLRAWHACLAIPSPAKLATEPELAFGTSDRPEIVFETPVLQESPGLVLGSTAVQGQPRIPALGAPSGLLFSSKV
jgi:hypothetical protein